MDYWRRIALPNAISTLKNDAFVTKHPSVFNSINDQFPFITDATATPLQQYAQQQEIATGPQLFILEDVTGAGKTEAAMVLLHRLMAQGLAQGAYIGLPTMATANSMYQRLSRSYRKLYSDSDTPSLVLAHGASQQTKAFTDSIALQEQVADRNYNQQDNTATAYCNAWLTDNRKKALLADIGVGTIDQALLSILPARHQSLRLLGLANKVLVVDEVHAFDDYMKTLLEQALKFHSAQGGSAILLSATLPRHYRQDFITAFSKGLADDNHSATPHICKNFEYPLATQCFGQGVSETHIETKKSVKRRVITKRIDSEAAAIKIIKSAVADGKCVCWIRNTVDSAYAAYSQL
ncbi:MAG: CRISPR-associated helicase Cas3', partial [Cellvibrionaceae bacterium]|nr:CRISPR-associated helicase Cas3' [Cellvibrionaceae bacterium]